MKNILIDTDIGDDIDDALAIGFALIVLKFVSRRLRQFMGIRKLEVSWHSSC